MQEDEIKLFVPESARKEVTARLTAIEGPRRQRLRAIYFDTPECELARQRGALRLRQEGRRWVQTFKMEGANALSRLELNHVRPGPQLDLGVYHDTPVADLFQKLDAQLSPRYETDITRLKRQVRTRYGVVEVAYDVGAIQAGALEIPVNELEFERVSGSVRAIFELARRWTRAHGLVLELRSKAERGDGLADVEAAVMQSKAGDRATVRELGFTDLRAPQHAVRITRLPGKPDAERALDHVTAACFEQIARNANMLAVSDALPWVTHYASDYVHQLRVGIRRLRSAWRLFEGWTPLPPIGLQLQARDHFQRLGAVRDADVFGESILPALQDAGMPPVQQARAAAESDPASMVRDVAFQVWLLDMLAWNVGVRASSAAAAKTAQLPMAGTVHQSASVHSLAMANPSDGHDATAHRQDAKNQTLHGQDADVQAGAARTHGGDNADATASRQGGSAQSAGVDAAKGKQKDASREHLSEEASDASTPVPPSLRDLLNTRLYKWHKRIVKQGRRYAQLTDDDKHSLRKRVKRLRYGLDYAAVTLPTRQTKKYRKQLSKVQELLGEFNDLVVARDAFEALTNAQPQAWFALGWIAAQLDMLTPRVEKVIKKLDGLYPYAKGAADTD